MNGNKQTNGLLLLIEFVLVIIVWQLSQILDALR